MKSSRLTRTRNRHSLLKRTKWWLRDKWRWFRNLAWWKKVLLIATPIIVVAVVIPLLMYVYFAATMGDMEHIMNRNNTGIVLKDSSGETFFSTGTAEQRELVPLDKIADSTKEALIASEDKNFYEHGGVSILSTLRALYGYIFSGGGGFGGSTLTQQLAKMTMLSDQRSALRQYQAFSVALAIENRYSKDEILAMYLNSAYFGNGAFGIEEAAKNYFNTTPDKLSLAQSAMLIGLLPAPGYYSPIEGDEALGVERQQQVLNRMVEEGYITEQERTDAMKVKLSYQPAKEISNEAPHFTEMVLEELYERYGEEQVQRSGYQVTTTLDLALQRQANEAIASQRQYIENMGGSNAGLIAIDPNTGRIQALVGSVDYANTKWGAVNMATTARQPGSSFKPIYYAAAMADGVITPATIIRDEAININGYSPKNATRQYYGDVTVRQALARSLNIPAVKIMQEYGVDTSIEAARKLGVTTLDDNVSYGLPLAIGSGEVPLQEITNAYAAFANGGEQYETSTIATIDDKFNEKIYENNPTSTQAISAGGAYLISSILSDESARAFMFGTALNVGGRTVAVKTGTTDDNRDAWTVGYTPNIAIGVWVGNNDNEVMVSGGSDMAGPIWRNVMTYATREGDVAFTQPASVVTRNVCYGSGGLAAVAGSNTYSEVFLATALPDESCTAAIEREEPATRPEEESDTNTSEEEPDTTEPVDPESPETDGTGSETDPTDPVDPTTPLPVEP